MPKSVWPGLAVDAAPGPATGKRHCRKGPVGGHWKHRRYSRDGTNYSLDTPYAFRHTLPLKIGLAYCSDIKPGATAGHEHDPVV